MASLKKLAGQTVIYGMGHVLPRIINFVVLTIYLTRKFDDPKDYGIFVDLYAWATVLLSIMLFRMDTAYFRYASEGDSKEQRSVILGNVFLPVISLSAIFVLLLLLFDDHIAVFLDYPGQGQYVRWFAFIIGFDSITTLIYSKFRLDSQPKRFLFYRVLSVLINISLLLIFIEFLPRVSPELKNSLDAFTNIFKDLDYVFFANLLASSMILILMIPELLKIKFSIDKVLLTKILKYSWPLVIVAVAGNINQVAAVPLQKELLVGDVKTQMGIYGAISKIAILLSLFTTAYNYAAEPFFFNNAKEEKKDIYGRAALAYTLFASIVVLGTFFNIDVIVYLIGPSYREGIVVVPILLLSYFVLGLYYNVSIWYKLSDNTRIASKISMIGVAVTFGLSILLLPVLGIVGSAWASLSCFSVMLMICYHLGQKYYPIVYPVVQILRIFFGTAFLLLGSYIFAHFIESKVIRLLVNNLVFVVYGFFLWKLYGQELIKNEKMN